MPMHHALIEKADLVLADLVDNGELKPEVARRFLRVLIKLAVIMPLSTVVGMRAPKRQIDKFRFANRVLRPGVSGEALLVAERSRPNLGPQVELDAQLVRGEVRLNAEVLEDQIEGRALRTTVMQELGKAISRDVEELAINGDLASTDSYLALLDGLLEQAVSNIVDAGGQTLNREVFRDLLKALPSEFHRNRPLMRFFTSTDAEIDWRDLVSTRQTATGDRALAATGDRAIGEIGAHGIPVTPVPLFPEDQGLGNDETSVLFLDPKNIQFGIYRNITFKTDEDVSSDELIIAVTMRLDTKYEHEPAVAKATAVRVQ